MGGNSKVLHLQNKWIIKLQYHNNQYIGIVKRKHIKFNAGTLSSNTCCILGLSFACGALVNGPYALITTAVSADLGTHKMLEGNSKALATVTAVIDGTGSIGEYLCYWQSAKLIFNSKNCRKNFLLDRFTII